MTSNKWLVIRLIKHCKQLGVLFKKDICSLVSNQNGMLVFLHELPIVFTRQVSSSNSFNVNWFSSFWLTPKGNFFGWCFARSVRNAICIAARMFLKSYTNWLYLDKNLVGMVTNLQLFSSNNRCWKFLYLDIVFTYHSSSIIPTNMCNYYYSWKTNRF